MKSLSQKLLSLLLIIGLNWTALSFLVNPTLAYYNDTETSIDNDFTAGSLDFSLIVTNWEPQENVLDLEPGEEISRTARLVNEGSLGFQYDVEAVKTSGDDNFCNALMLKATLNEDPMYDGSLLSFVSPITAFATSTDQWNFMLSLPGGSPAFDQKECNFDFDVNGWQENFVGPLEGFHDSETIPNTVASGEVLSCPAEAPTEIISTVMVGTDFDFTDKHVVIANGGALELTTGSTELDITTNCNFTIEDGGEVRANGINGGTINLNVGGDLSVAGDSIEAMGALLGSGTQSGGTINIEVNGNFTLTGDIKASAHENGGDITIEVEGDATITETGRILAQSQTGAGTNTGGTVTIDVGGIMDSQGEINVFGQEQGGTIKIIVNGATTIGGDSLKATGAMSGAASNKGGIVRVTSEDNLTVTGLIDVSAQDQPGIIELVTEKIFDLSSSAILNANGDDSASGTQRGGNITIIALEGNSTINGMMTAQAQEFGGNITATVNGDLAINGTVEVNVDGGTGAGTQQGGTVVFTTPKNLDIAGTITAIAQEVNGIIRTNYCTKDFTGGTFTPAPVEVTNCDSILINEFLPNPLDDDDAPMPNGEWVELYNYGLVAIDVAGWILYDANDIHDLLIMASSTDTGGTVIPAGGFLVVYRDGDSNFELNNTGGDTIRLYDGAIGSGGLLRDMHTYTQDAPSGKSFARVPDGGAWYDPTPTPGESNEGSYTDYMQYFFLNETFEGGEDYEFIEEGAVEEESAMQEATQEPIKEGGSLQEEQTDEIVKEEEAPLIQNDATDDGTPDDENGTTEESGEDQDSDGGQADGTPQDSQPQEEANAEGLNGDTEPQEHSQGNDTPEETEEPLLQTSSDEEEPSDPPIEEISDQQDITPDSSVAADEGTTTSPDNESNPSQEGQFNETTAPSQDDQSLTN